jgi:type II secretory ATPase GspE/PulE/Tfp pilus assembly ATPase PilB-like protein
MVERGRGILLVAAPVAGGRSSTYYALLQHAAQAGKTVYSVERSIDYEIPAVAQVLVNPGSPVGAASYFAAGMRQDTDMLAIDSMQSVEDVHLAIEAAGMGKLVIATFAGADIVTAVRRMLDLGAEPVSLASALTLGIGQRVVRMNCPNCSADEKSPLTAKIAGAEKNMTTRKGAGCPNCGRSGFVGASGIFEVLPFTESVRAQIARNATAEQLAASAKAAGMRPMIASGLAKVRDGLVSVEELDRVLRFSVAG